MHVSRHSRDCIFGCGGSDSISHYFRCLRMRHHVAMSWMRLVFPVEPLLWLGLGSPSEYGTEDCELSRAQTLEATALAFHIYHKAKDTVPPEAHLTFTEAERIAGAARLALRV
eukprot:7939973-Pyramimonas_sp.AAC.1